MIRVGAGLSTDLTATRAAAEATAEAAASMAGEVPNLVVAMISEDHREFAEEIAEFLGDRFPGAAVIGCTAAGVAAGDRELEQGPALSVMTAYLPETEVVPFGLRFVETGDGQGEYVGWPKTLSPDATLLTLCDRFSFPAGHFLQYLNDTRPGQLVIGGLATGGSEPGDTRLFFSGRVFTEGAVVVAISGRVRVQTLVSQGCRPVGEPATVTRADRQVIFELAGKRPIDLLGEVWKNADPRDRSLLQQGPQIGVVIDEYKQELERGDFLIRPVIGGDSDSGVIAVGDMVEVGTTVQFHVRDPKTADEDLHHLLESITSRPAAALLFTCNGRGTNMFDEPDHDASAITTVLGVPLVGMSCAGELGPVGGRNFMHGQTASIALFVDSAG